MPPPDDRPTFPELVATELKSARQQFPRFASRDEAFGVILEEIDEFWDKVKHHQRGCPLRTIGCFTDRTVTNL